MTTDEPKQAMTDPESEETDSTTRRRVLTGAGALAITGVAYNAGQASATTPDGTVGPYETASVTSVEFVPLASAPSSESGTATLYWRDE